MSAHGKVLPRDEAVPYLAQGYLAVSRINGQVVGIMRFLYTWAIVVGLDEHGYDHRYCYADADAAVLALFQWLLEGGEEPTGYIKRKG